jgi:prepilin-type N-terminal cleavage/methylation domain-containing protein
VIRLRLDMHDFTVCRERRRRLGVRQQAAAFLPLIAGIERTNRACKDGASKLAHSKGFTLLEVLVSLTVLAIGASLALSLISGSLGNIRKVQQKTRTVEHAEAVMELALLDDSNNGPRSFSGDFEDGTRWMVRIENYEMPTPEGQQPRSSPQNMPVKLLSYTVEMFSPDSRVSDYRLQTLKLARTTPEDQRMRIQQ